MKTSVIKLLEKYHLGELIAWVDIIFITLEIGFIVLCTWLIFKASHQLISNIETKSVIVLMATMCKEFKLFLGYCDM
ncbi:MAG: hypothetical protein EBQ70_12400 [Betaproteobacteria bacterium]|nr:hypothetical protein [Betaproteobacteria bacterium]